MWAALLLLVTLLSLSQLAVVDAECITMKQPCGPLYWCCSCGPRTKYQLNCDYVYVYGGLRCTTTAFMDKCYAIEGDIMSALQLPRKLSRSAGGFSQSQLP
uniref:Uncharacterized protein n=1 Tax=Physcomitrium patens TaxID=3218 RepID=A0A2K1L0D6_PHYPA|nr:hypothetical protein PHYPA_002278 [Physcomitrium patens]